MARVFFVWVSVFNLFVVGQELPGHHRLPRRDVLGAQAASALFAAGQALAGVALAAVPLTLAWLAAARYLRDRHASLEGR